MQNSNRVEYFLSTLLKTNKSYGFYVDWSKANRNVDIYKDELALLSNMSEDDINPSDELKRLIIEYPKIIELIPLLLAFRAKKNKSIATVLEDDKATIAEFDFNRENVTENSAERATYFADRTGLLDELSNIKNVKDYYFGVEVGMDTNARKNRSGNAMENLIEEYAEGLIEKSSDTILKQKNFRTAAKQFGVNTPLHSANKKGDFMIFARGMPVNIEVNYFDGGGSKQEVMNSYISRAIDLKEAGWKFGLVTDGPGWLKNKKQIEDGFTRIGNIFNVRMCQDGELEKLIGI